MKQKISKSLIKTLFESADQDQNGTIDTQEMFKLIKVISDKVNIELPSNEEIEQILQEYDTNGDGILQLDEFEQFIRELFDDEDDTLDEQYDMVEIKPFNQNLNEQFKKENQGFINLKQNLYKNKKLSIMLDEQIKNLAISLKYGDAPKTCKEKDKWLQQQQKKEQQSLKDYESYKKRKEIAENILSDQQTYIIKKNQELNISSVYSYIKPNLNQQGPQSVKNSPNYQQQPNQFFTPNQSKSKKGTYFDFQQSPQNKNNKNQSNFTQQSLQQQNNSQLGENNQIDSKIRNNLNNNNSNNNTNQSNKPDYQKSNFQNKKQLKQQNQTKDDQYQHFNNIKHITQIRKPELGCYDKNSISIRRQRLKYKDFVQKQMQNGFINKNNI